MLESDIILTALAKNVAVMHAKMMRNFLFSSYGATSQRLLSALSQAAVFFGSWVLRMVSMMHSTANLKTGLLK